MGNQPIRASTRTRSGDREARKFDQTYLSENQHGRIVHRDYAAHFFRWGFAKRLITKDDVVVDIGCGPEIPLIKVLTGHGLNICVKHIVGVDINPLRARNRQRITTLGETDATTASGRRNIEEALRPHGGHASVVTCFEVIEHMDVRDGLKLLQTISKLLHPGGTLLLSTPVYDGKGRARNHIHEYTIVELEAQLRKASFTVERRFGTFMNVATARKVATPEQLAMLKQLGQYYDNDVLSTFLAPLYPDHARNNLWVCRA